MNPLIHLESICKVYGSGDLAVQALLVSDRVITGEQIGRYIFGLASSSGADLGQLRLHLGEQFPDARRGRAALIRFQKRIVADARVTVVVGALLVEPDDFL